MCERGRDVADACADSVDGRWGGHADLVWKAAEGISFAFASGFPSLDFVTSVMFKGRPDVPGVFTVWGPRSALLGLLMNENARARGTNGGAIIVVYSVNLVPC